jgi:hypothetical protein
MAAPLRVQSLLTLRDLCARARFIAKIWEKRASGENREMPLSPVVAFPDQSNGDIIRIIKPTTIAGQVQSNETTGGPPLDRVRIGRTAGTNVLDPLDIPGRLDEIGALKGGWLDGEGVALDSTGLDWLRSSIRDHYADSLPLPRT